MKAGRELDALVAEKVMGFNNKGRTDTGEEYVMYSYQPYSTDIAAAWQVVEKLKEIGRDTDLELEIKLSAEYPDDVTVAVKWFDPDPVLGGHGPFYFTAPTAPHAICLAALKAVGVQVGWPCGGGVGSCRRVESP